MVTLSKRRTPDPFGIRCSPSTEFNEGDGRPDSRSLALVGGRLTRRRECDRGAIRVTTPASHAVTDLLAHQHHDQTTGKYNGASDYGNLIICELCS